MLISANAKKEAVSFDAGERLPAVRRHSDSVSVAVQPCFRTLARTEFLMNDFRIGCELRYQVNDIA